MSPYEVVALAGGASALRHTAHGEIMHPGVGPWVEATELYARQLKVAERLAVDVREPLRVLDVGLGGAANAAAAICSLRARGPVSCRPLHLTSLENDLGALRLALEHTAAFPFLRELAPACTELMRRGRYEEPGLSWELRLGDGLAELRALRGASFEVVFFDPFSPQTNPTLWTVDALSALRATCRDDGDGALVATYSASTRTRVSFLLSGFFVGVGAAVGGKAQTTLASTRLEALAAPLGARWLLRWQRSSARGPWTADLTAELERGVLEHPQFKRGLP